MNLCVQIMNLTATNQTITAAGILKNNAPKIIYQLSGLFTLIEPQNLKTTTLGMTNSLTTRHGSDSYHSVAIL
mgnify:CR=1 FL=1